MASRPPPTPSNLQDAQRTRVVVDAVVQAGLSARIAFSLLGGLAGYANRVDDDRVKQLVQEAQEAAERAKNADITLDMAFTRDELEPAEALRDASQALSRAADAFEIAAEMHERLSVVETASNDAEGQPGSLDPDEPDA